MSGRRARLVREARGQVAVLLVGGLVAVGAGAVVLGAFAAGLGGRDAAQRAADLAALAGARAMHDAYERLFEPARIEGRPNPRHLDKDAYLALGRDAATRVARANGAPRAEVGFPDAQTIAPVRISVDVRARIEVGSTGITMHAERRGRAGAARPARASPPSPPAAATTGRSRIARGSRCGRTSRRRSTGWRGRRPRTGSRW